MTFVDDERQWLRPLCHLGQRLARSVEHGDDGSLLSQRVVSSRAEETNVALPQIGELDDRATPLMCERLSRHYDRQLEAFDACRCSADGLQRDQGLSAPGEDLQRAAVAGVEPSVDRCSLPGMQLEADCGD